MKPGARERMHTTRLKTGALECTRTTLKQETRECAWEQGWWLAVLKAQRTEMGQPWNRGLGEWLWGAQPGMLRGFLAAPTETELKWPGELSGGQTVISLF